MAAARIRIHEATGMDGRPTTIVGISGISSEAPLFRSPALIEWAVSVGTTPRKLPDGLAPRGGISDDYTEFEPPLSNDQLPGLAAVCIGGTYEGVEYPGCLDTTEGAFVFDNREVAPTRDTPANLLATVSQFAGQQALAA